MQENSEHWTPYYRGDEELVSQLKHFSYSDRIRYYWTVPGVAQALGRLFDNLSDIKIPETIVSQYFSSRQFGSMDAPASQLTADHIALCVGRYYEACIVKDNNHQRKVI